MSKEVSTEHVYAMRHSMAHIMATAIQELYPETKFGIGPVVENGFYYDIDLPERLNEDDLKAIEKKMKEVVKSNYPFEQSNMALEEAIEHFSSKDQVYKVDLLNDLKEHGTTVAKDIDRSQLGIEDGSKIDHVSIYTNGPFTDLCRGPHLESTGRVGAFKLMRVSGAYWRGDDKNAQLQRIYGVGFTTKEELNEHLTMLTEAEKRDHRKLGRELDLFIFSDLVGPGLPLWTPRGTTIRRELNNFVQELRDEYDFQEVTIPHITKKELYEKSGHWEKFKDDLFRIETREGHEFAMKPMNCPHHTQIFDSRPRSYREMPVRYRETTMVYRDEQSGELGGLGRVRSITQDDAHVFCRSTQIKTEVLQLWDIIERFYGTFGLDLRLRISTHDPENMKAYSGSGAAWVSSVDQLKAIAEEKLGNDYEMGVGEAAFYGPKLDFMARDAIGREHQVATIQLDFNQPEGFDLNCINEQGENERVVMIHCAIMGSLERFLVVLIEHTAGRFPLWLAPEQVRVTCVNDDPKVIDCAKALVRDLKLAKIRTELDITNESVGKKIRSAELAKVPYTVVVGAKEAESGLTIPRIRADLAVSNSEDHTISFSNFIKSVSHEITSRASRSSL
jgi:threonyl-tRNA synthetase